MGTQQSGAGRGDRLAAALDIFATEASAERSLAAGVPGAYRILANFVSARLAP